MDRGLLGAARTVALVTALALVGLLGAAGAAVASPAPGLYEGSLNGITVAATVSGSGARTVVSHTAAVCGAGDGSAESGVDDDGHSLAYRVNADGRFGSASDDDDGASGRLQGTGGTIAITRHSEVVENCDPTHSTGPAGYPIPVTLIGPARTTPDGVWRADQPGQSPDQEPVEFEVFGGGAFVGEFNGGALSTGPGQSALCWVYANSTVESAGISATGAFTLPWESDLEFGIAPTTPMTGQLTGATGTLTFVLDSPFNTGLISSSCPLATTPQTIPAALTTRMKVGTPSAAPRSGPIPEGGTAPSTRCAHRQFRTTAGPFVLCTTARPHRAHGVATLHGRVTINGFLYAEVKDLQVDLRAGRLHSDGAVQFGAIVGGYDVPLGEVSLDLRARTLGHTRLPGLRSELKLGGLHLDLSRLGGSAPTVDIDLAAGTLSVSAGIDYRLAATTLSLQGAFTVGSGGVVVDLHSDGLALPVTIAGRQLFALHSLDLHYDQADDAWTLGGGAEVSLPDAPGIDASVKGGIRHGRFDSLALALAATDGTGLPGPFDTYLSGGSFDLSGISQGFAHSTIGLGLDGGWPLGAKRVVGVTFTGTGSFDVARERLTLAAHADVTAGDTGIAKGRAQLVLGFAPPSFLLDSHIDVLDIIHGSATLHITAQHFLTEGELVIEFGPDSPPIHFLHSHLPFPLDHAVPDHIGPLLSAQAIVSDLGAGARAHVSLLGIHLGATVLERWGHSLQVDVGFGSTRRLTGLDPFTSDIANGARARARGRTAPVRVPARQQALVISATGAPHGVLVVRDPRGRTVLDTRRIHRPRVTLDRGAVLFVRDAATGQAGLVVHHPRAGRWRVTSRGAHPFRSVRATTVAPPGAGLGRVLAATPRRRVRAGSRIRVRVDVPRGDTVQLRGVGGRRGDPVGVALGTVRHRTARVRIPADYPSRRLFLLAITHRDGVPVGRALSRIRISVLPRRLGRPRHLRVSRGRHTVVHFARARGAGRYVVTVRLRGRRYETVVDHPPARLALDARGARTVVTVRGVSARTGAIGRGVTARLPGSVPRHGRHHRRGRPRQ